MAVSDSAQIKHALKNKPVKNSLIFISLIAVASALWIFFQQEEQAIHIPPVRVEIAPVEQRDVPRYLTAIGTVQSPHSVTITPQVDGELKAVHFREGEHVKRGQLLAEIDDRRIRATLAQAKADKRSNEALLNTAASTLQRYQNLLKDDAITPQTVDQQAAEVARLEAAIASAEAAITNASVQLDYTQIKSPIDGRAGIRRIDAGNIVRANDTSSLLTVTQLQPIDVIFSLPQDDLPKLQKVLVKQKSTTQTSQAVDSIVGRAETRARDSSDILDIGRLQTIDNQVNASTGTVQLKARFTNEKQNLWPGQFVVTRLCVDIFHNATVVPLRAVMRGRDKPFVYRINNDQAEAVDINVIFEDDQYAVIESPLKINDAIVIDGQLKLKSGTAVSIVNAEKKPSASPEGK